MSIDSATQAGTLPAARTPQPGAPTPALYAPTGGFNTVARALREPVPARLARPAPPTRRLLGLCVAAAVLSFAGIVLGVRGWVGLVMHRTESWFLPAIVLLGVVGVLTAASSFLTVHRRHTPWVMLCLSALVLITAMVVTGAGVR
ncbi:MAG TPA: hypothetical protein VHA75_19200 [Rugosimonospora sp.]|nr:hypothetical protein [Rugosimonospora sp.]